MSVPSGVICSLEDYTRSNATYPEVHCLTRGQSIGLVLVAESGFISLIAVLWVFVVIFRNLRRYAKSDKDASIWSIPLEPMDVFMLSLFSADLVQALGAIMDVKWIQDGKVEIGSFCSAQGVIQQLGETGVAITTLVIAIYSFIGIWWRLGTGPRRTLTAKAIITAVWLFVVLIVLIPNLIHRDKHQLYQAPTPYWCWIGGEFNGLRIAGEYIWLWLTLIFSLVAYVPLFLWKLGYISPREDKWWKVSFHQSREVDSTGRGRDSFAMIAYPLVYSILVLPLSIVRWNAFSQESRDAGAETPSAATLSVISIYGFSGAFNVLLLFITRPASRLFGRTQHEGLHTPKGSDGTSLRDSEDLRRPHHSPNLPMNSLTGRPLGRLPSLDSE